MEKLGKNQKKLEGVTLKHIHHSLVVQWLRLHTPNGGSLGSIPDQGTKSTKDPACWEKKKIPHATTKTQPNK